MPINWYSVKITRNVDNVIIFNGFFNLDTSNNIIRDLYETIDGETVFYNNILIPTPTGTLQNSTYLGFNLYNIAGFKTYDNAYLSNWKQFDNYGVVIKSMSTFPGYNQFSLRASGYADEAINNNGLITIDKITQLEDVSVTYDINPISDPSLNIIIKVTSITLTPNRYTIRKGGRKKLSFSILPKTATKQTVTWTSSKRNVAVVNSSGFVTAKKIFGKTIITATTKDGGKKAKSIITVGIPVAKIKVTPKILIMKKGTSKKLSTIVSPANASDKGLFLKSYNTSVATVKSGKVIAKGNGSTKISVKSADGSLKTAIIIVKVK